LRSLTGWNPQPELFFSLERVDINHDEALAAVSGGLEIGGKSVQQTTWVSSVCRVSGAPH